MSSVLRGLTGSTLLLLLIAGAMLLTTAPSAAQDIDEDEPTPPPIPITGDELRNLSYPNEWPADGVAPLTDGVYTEPIPDSVAQVRVEFRRAAFGQLDGRAAAAVVLATSGGGTGTFYELHAVTRDEDGEPRSVARHLLGDRIGLQGLTFDGDVVRVDFIGFAPSDGLCCPTLAVTREFGLRDGELVFLHGAESPVWLPIAQGSSFVSWFRGPTTSRAILASAGLLDRVWVLDPSDGRWVLDARHPAPGAGAPILVEQGSHLVLVARAATNVPVLLLRAPAACPLNPGPPNPTDPSMIVDGPGNGERFAGAVAVSGLARVFEANVRVRILDAGGAVLADTFTTAEVGGPEFGAFSADIPVDVAEETEACVQIFEQSARDGLDVNVVQIGVTLLPALPALPADFPAALLYPGATVVSDSRSSNDEGETFVTAHLAVDAGTADILAFYESAFAALDAPGQVFDGYTGPNDTPVVYLALQDVSYAAAAVVREGAAPGGATLVEVTINLNPPG